MPHADDAPGRPARCPDEHDQPRLKHPDRHEPGLTVIEAVIDAREMNAREDLLRPAHVETPLGQRARPLSRVTGDAHVLTVATLIPGVNLLCDKRYHCPARHLRGAPGAGEGGRHPPTSDSPRVGHRWALMVRGSRAGEVARAFAFAPSPSLIDAIRPWASESRLAHQLIARARPARATPRHAR